MKHCLSAIILLLAVAAVPAPGQDIESIRKFHSDISVNREGTMTVTETITVMAAGDKIKRGIYRDFPTRYRNSLGLYVIVPFEVDSVMKDGKSEPFRLDDYDRGVRVYIGDPDVYLNPGVYTYTIRYRTWRQVGFTDGFTELYWNVTGNEWDFIMESVTARVSMPVGSPTDILTVEGFTGPVGAAGKDYVFEKQSGGTVTFANTRMLFSGEGLTVRVRIKPGLITRPRENDGYQRLLGDNKAAVALLAGLIIILFFYYSAWARAGRDPEGGPVVQRIAPPGGISPAAARYIMGMGYDDRCFTAALVDLAVKGAVTINENNGAFTLNKTGADPDGLPAEEKVLLKSLFGSGGTVTLDRHSNRILRTAITEVKSSLSFTCEKHFFVRNLNLFIPGIALSAFFILLAIVLEFFVTSEAFLLVWLTGWTAGLAAMLWQLVKSWRRVAARTSGCASTAGAIAFTVFSIPFIAAEIGVAFMYCTKGSPPLLASLVLIMAANAVFYRLLRAPTRAGRVLMDGIEGFAMYLRSKEKFAIASGGPMTSFEEQLPYAIALDAETDWARRFATAVAGASEQSYSPVWYHGRTWHYGNIDGFTESIGSGLSASVTASSYTPGSSSGGGSSGGGGGGGGGGGW